jgi:hypothetical protein
MPGPTGRDYRHALGSNTGARVFSLAASFPASWSLLNTAHLALFPSLRHER